MTRGFVLSLINISKPFEVEKNISDFITHEGHLIHESRKLNSARRRYVVSEKEMLAVIGITLCRGWTIVPFFTFVDQQN